MRQVLAVVLALCACVVAIPPDVYSESELVDVVELDVEKRSLDNRKYRVRLFGEDVTLNLQRSKEFSPETLMAHFLDVDEQGNRVVEDYTHRTGGGKDLYYDPETTASILINELDGRTKVEGSIRGEFVIEPVDAETLTPDQLLVPATLPVRHRIYRTNVTHLTNAAIKDFIPQTFTEGDDDDDEAREKRAIPAKIYPQIHALVDYSHYKKLALSEAKVLEYIRILYHTAQVSHFATMTNPSCQISLQGITVCKSDAACAELNKGKWSYGEYKYPMDNIGKFAYQERSRTGTDYDLMFVTTSNKICPKPGECGVGGFGPMPGACSAFSSYYQSTSRGGIMIDNGGYDSVRGLGHEIGHMLNMPHDGDAKYQYADRCKGGTSSGDFIMGQTKYSPNNWKFSTCSMYYLHLFLNKKDSDCIKTPPSSNQIGGWPSDAIAGRYMNLDTQCKAIFGGSYRSCLSTASRHDRICQKLPCNTGGPGRGGCIEFHLAAAEGSPCGPGLWCQKGYCVTFSNEPWGKK